MLSSDDVAICAGFLDLHLTAMCGNHRDYSLSDDSIVGSVACFRELPCTGPNPLKGARWSDLVDFGEEEDAALADAGYETAKVTRIIADRGYAFARALDGSRDFYVHHLTTELSAADFAALRPGTLVSVLAADSSGASTGRAWPAKHVMLA